MEADLAGRIEKSRRKRLSFWIRYAMSFTGTAADAEDAVQDALQRVLQADPKLETEVDVHRYVLVAIRTSSFKLLKKRSRFIPVEDVSATWQDTDDGVLKHLVDREVEQSQSELATAATKEVGKLPREQREAVELLIMREPPMKLREVAEIQGVAISTVHKRLRSALQELSVTLAEGRR